MEQLSARPEWKVDGELDRVLRIASWVGLESGDDVLRSYTSILIGFLWADDPTSKWIQNYCQDAGVKVEAIYARRRIKEEKRESILSGAGDYPELKGGEPESTSARTILRAASDIARKTSSGEELGPRHVIAAYIFRNPPGHDSQLRAWGFQRDSWSKAFREFLETAYPAEFTHWHGVLGLTDETTVSAEDIPLNAAVEAVVERAGAAASGALTPKDLLTAVLAVGLDSTDPDVDGAALAGVIAPTSTNQETLAKSVAQDFTSGDRTDARLAREARDILVRAQDLSRAISEVDEVGTRHLIASLVLSDDAAVQSELGKFGVRSTEIRDSLYRKFIARWNNDDPGQWHFHLIGVASPIVSGYDSDLAKGTDRADVTRFATAFAAVMAHPDAHPPLAIGVFGDWGAGKSFFMRLMENQIARVMELPQEPRIFCRKVASIWFNAWHYAESNLLASLVHTILVGLHNAMGAKEEGSEKLDRLLGELELAKQSRQDSLNALETAKKRAEESRKQLAAAVKAQEVKAESRKLDLTEVLDVVRTEVFAGAEWEAALEIAQEYFGMQGVQDRIKKATDKVAESERVAHEARAVVEQSRSAWTWLLRAPFPWGTMIVAVLVIAVGTALAVSLQDEIRSAWPAVSAVVAELTVVAGIALNWARKVLGKVSSGLGAFNKVRVELDSRLSAATEDVSKARKELDEATREVDVKRSANEASEREVTRLTQDVEDWKPARRIARLIEERLDGKDYEKYLGLVTATRKDFATLSRLLSEVADEDGPTTETSPPSRIILYIDDLDRCPTDQVVRVLEAVHLLLQTDLFVVVVGVDVRWAAQSLHDKYPNHLTAGAFESHDGVAVAGEAGAPAGGRGEFERASALDYLEKIFQIPFWIPPMEEDASRTMIGALVPPVRGEGTASDDEKDEDRPADADQTATQSVEESASQPQAEGDAEGEAVKALTIFAHERTFMLSLAGAVGKSPRRLKRFVNTYRILKASCNALQREEFVLEEGKRGQYQAAMTLLAIATGAPRSALELMKKLTECEKGESFKTQRADIEAAARQEELEYVRTAFGAYLDWPSNLDANVDDFRYWAPRVARFSFRSGRW